MNNDFERRNIGRVFLYAITVVHEETNTSKSVLINVAHIDINKQKGLHVLRAYEVVLCSEAL